MTTLSVRNLTVSLGGKPILRDVTAEFAPGGLIGLIGPNGAGKSTLLRAMAHLIPHDSGMVAMDGQDIDGIPTRALARKIAYLPQGHTLHWPLRADHVVALGRLPHRARPDRDAAAVRTAMQRADVGQFAERIVTTLSGGERARIMLARALAVEAPVLLVDEPVASLDPYHQLHVMELLRELAKEGRLVVAVLHDLPLATRFCDRLVMLKDGTVIAQGCAADVLSRENLQHTYSVEGVFGRENDEQFVLAWRRLAAAGAELAHV
ncbi:MAG: ABC transporter ATP-binding protein [Alphaproteobacteria bacterium]|nr:ABC transporter ATP-binding protein [Alphaproteobacteria bacterium]MBL7098070.1 ABC transporter ATP-binding protein [Alphaproteobacteria bacterium]